MNSKLSNGSWSRKRELLANDNIEMNRRIARAVPVEETWGEDQIQQRGADLARYVKKVWPGPGTISEMLAGAEPGSD